MQQRADNAGNQNEDLSKKRISKWLLIKNDFKS